MQTSSASTEASQRPRRSRTPPSRDVPAPKGAKVIRAHWPPAMGLPEPGTWIWSQAERVAYRVVQVQVLHQAIYSRKPRFKLAVQLVQRSAIPDGVNPLPWSITEFDEAAWSQDRARTEAAISALPTPEPQQPEPVPAGPDRGPMQGFRAVTRGAGAAQPSTWSDPEDVGRFGKHARMVGGYRAKCVLRQMRARSGSSITDRHVVAADLMRVAYDVRRLGRTAARNLIEERGAPQRGPTSGPPPLAFEQTAADRDWRRLMAILRPMQPAILLAVVIDGQRVKPWCRAEAERTGVEIDRNQALGRLVTLLDVVADYFDSEVTAQLRSGYPVD